MKERGLERRCDLPVHMPWSFCELGLEPGNGKCSQHCLRYGGTTGVQERDANCATLQCSCPTFLWREADRISAWFTCFPMDLLQAWLSRLILEAVSSTSSSYQSCSGNQSWLEMTLNVWLPCVPLATVLVGC